jgi:hypothetical protein
VLADPADEGAVVELVGGTELGHRPPTGGVPPVLHVTSTSPRRRAIVQGLTAT